MRNNIKFGIGTGIRVGATVASAVITCFAIIGAAQGLSKVVMNHIDKQRDGTNESKEDAE